MILTASEAKTSSGKLMVQKEGWAEAVSLSYSIKLSQKAFITLGEKQVIVNKNAADIT